MSATAAPEVVGFLAEHPPFDALAAAYFYGRLFAENPRLRVMFPAAMDYQRDRLFWALTRIVCTLGRPEEMESFVCQLGQDHRKYGVQAEHYPAVGRALLDRKSVV